MRTAGIIAEYNPFHNGHAWQIAELKKRGFEAVVCVCSPGVVQRGTAALFPARVRTRAALAAGADLVLSLPAPYATLSAEGFAAAGVALLSALGCVDALCFGTETRRLEPTQGVTTVKRHSALNLFVSIHTPTQGVTTRLYLNSGTSSFNPHTHAGCDNRIRKTIDFYYVSIHTPTQGVTFLNWLKAIPATFQSTHPRRV